MLLDKALQVGHSRVSELLLKMIWPRDTVEIPPSLAKLTALRPLNEFPTFYNNHDRHFF